MLREQNSEIDKLERKIFSHEDLLISETGKKISWLTRARIELSRERREKSQQLAEKFASGLGVQLKTKTNIVRLDLITDEVQPVFALARTNLNPEFAAQQSRKRKKEYQQYRKTDGAKGTRLFFVVAAFHGRVDAKEDYREDVRMAKRKLSRTLLTMSKTYKKSFVTEVVTTEKTLKDGTLYFHFNVIVNMIEAPDYNQAFKYSVKPHNIRNSLVWGNSGIQYSRRTYGFGQMVERFRSLCMRWTGYFSFNGPCKDDDEVFEYVTKPQEITDEMDDDIFANIFENDRNVRTYTPKGAFAEYLRKMRAENLAIIEINGKTALRKVQQGDFGEEYAEDSEENSDDGEKISENRIINRQSPYFGSLRYKTPGLLIQNYTPHPTTKRGIGNLLFIRDWSKTALEAFEKNSGTTLEQAKSEHQIYSFILHTLTEQNVSLDSFTREEFHSLITSMYDSDMQEVLKSEGKSVETEEKESQNSGFFYTKHPDYPDFLSVFAGM